MGRRSTGAWTVYESTRLDLSWLIKRGYIKKNCFASGNLYWSDNWGKERGSISFTSHYRCDEEDNCIKLKYTATDRNGLRTDYNYKIYLIERPSNLGKGSVLYFQCPVTGQKCRILYMAYGSTIFKARTAYTHRLYYDCQLSSKLNKYNDNYWRLNSHMEKIAKPAGKGWRKYEGLLTRRAVRYQWLLGKQFQMDTLRWSAAGMPYSLRKTFAASGHMF